MLARVYDGLRSVDSSLNADPKSWSWKEIDAFITWMRHARKGIAYQVKLVQYLEILTTHFENGVVEKMRRDGYSFPRTPRKRLRAPNESEIASRLQALEGVSGWRGHVVRFATAFYFFTTGTRVKELRLAGLKDLDLKSMRFTIAHPKGEGLWADGGDVLRLPEWFRIIASDFLDARARRCDTMGLDPAKVEPLIPRWGGMYYSESGWRGVRVKAHKSVGVSGNYRELRPGHAMLLKKKGVSIEAVSKRLRHASTVVTEAFYARIADEDAEEACMQVLDTIQPTVKPNFRGK